MSLDNAVGAGQSQASVAVAFRGEKGLETAASDFFRHTVTDIADLQDRVGRVLARANRNRPPLWHGIDCVKDKSGEYFGKFGFVSEDRCFRLKFRANLYRGAIGLSSTPPFWFGHRDTLLEDGVEVDNFEEFGVAAWPVEFVQAAHDLGPIPGGGADLSQVIA